MSRNLNLEIKETAEELKNLLKKENNIQVKERLHALYLLKSGKVTTGEALAEWLVRDTSTIYRWLDKYKSAGLSGLINIYKPLGRCLSIPPDILEKLKDKLITEPKSFNTYRQIQLWLKENYNIEVDYHAVYRTVRYKLKFKFKTQRANDKKK